MATVSRLSLWIAEHTLVGGLATLLSACVATEGLSSTSLAGEDSLREPGGGVSTSGSPDGEAPVVPLAPACEGTVYTRIRAVSTAAELEKSIEAATPGDLIQLADGVYPGQFTLRTQGTEQSPITLCGGRGAILDGGGLDAGTVTLKLSGASHWTIRGLRVIHSERGILAERATRNTLRGLEVSDVRAEGIILRAFSTDNIVEDCSIHDTGRAVPDLGAGLHVGSWWGSSGWARFTGGQPDRSDRNEVRGNTFGPNITAESIEVWAGTTGTKVTGNTFDGAGMNGGGRWVSVTGNDGVYERNVGTTTTLNGVEVRESVAGWGTGNVLRGNTARISASGGVAFYVQSTALAAKVYCSDHPTPTLRNIAQAIGGAQGVILSNQPCHAGQ